MRNGENFTEEQLSEAERAVRYVFRDRELLKESLTHKSWSNAFGGKNNERLEFLGDAVLELIVSERLFAQRPQAEEGELTALRQDYVSKTALYALCARENFMRFLRYSGSERNLGNKTVESLPEALLGAIYSDGGIEPARAFVARFIVAAETVNYKSLLQEYVQKRAEAPPRYVCEAAEGKFLCTVNAMGRSARGEGTNKQSAEIEAAEKLYRKLTENS